LFDVARRILKAARRDRLRMKKLRHKNLIRVYLCPSVVEFP
jgi:hypothetical protein